MSKLSEMLKQVKSAKITLSNFLLLFACGILSVSLVLLFEIANVSREILVNIEATPTKVVDAAAGVGLDTSELLDEVKKTRELACEIANNTDNIGRGEYAIGQKRTCVVLPYIPQ